jgi:hypothetical protein
METKKKYAVPNIELILLDNEISLSLESPPIGPDESIRISSLAPEYFNNDPLKTNLS